MNAGKGLYIEGCDFGYDNHSTQLYSKFGCTYLDDGNSSGNVQYVTGQSSSIAEGKTYDYLYNEGPDRYVDVIGPNGGTIFFKSQENNGRCVNYGGISNSYRAIHSTFIFGALRNGSNTKNELMAIYMDYLLGGGPEVSELINLKFPKLSIVPNPFTSKVELKLTLARSEQVSIKVYNCAGQLVNNLHDGFLTEGIHRLVWNGKDNSGNKISSGSYLLRIESGADILNRILVVVK